MKYTKKAIVKFDTSESAMAHFYQSQNEWDAWYYDEIDNGQAGDSWFLPYNYVSATVCETLLKDMPQAERFIANHQAIGKNYPASISIVDFDSSTTDFQILNTHPPSE